MKNLKSPPSGALSIDQSRSTGSPLHLSEAFYMEKPKLIQDLGRMPFGNGKYITRFGIFECPLCGKHFRANTGSVKRGGTVSCGCYKRAQKSEFMKNLQTRYTHRLTNTRLYSLWADAKKRCYNKKSQYYKDYGGRGIVMCEEWKNDFKSFYDWAMVHGYKDELMIDRERVNGNYDPSNCRFVTPCISAQNTRLLRSDNKTGYRGVSVFGNKWMGNIQWNKKLYYLGLFNTPELAAEAYNNFVVEHKTEHPLNILPKPNNYVQAEIAFNE